MSTQYIPNYIKRSLNYNPKDILTAQEYNAILNLIITQGDYNSEWLEYLQNEGIPDAIAEISATEIAQAISEAVTQEIAELTASVINKTSAQLNNPLLTILNTGIQKTGIGDFKLLLDSKSLTGTISIATNLVGYSSAYPNLTELNALKAAGYDIVAYSTDGAPVSAGTAESVAAATETYMTTNGFNTDVFVYPSGNSDTDVRDIIHDKFHYAVNIANNSLITPDGIIYDSPASVLGNISVIKYDDTVTVDSVKAQIADVVQYNKYMILWVDSDSAHYDEVGLEEILDYALTHTGIVYPTNITSAMQEIHETIGNKLLLVDGIYITEENGEKYLNW